MRETTIAPADLRTIIRICLDAALAGDEAARRKYETQRVLFEDGASEWLKAAIQYSLETAYKATFGKGHRNGSGVYAAYQPVAEAIRAEVLSSGTRSEKQKRFQTLISRLDRSSEGIYEACLPRVEARLKHLEGLDYIHHVVEKAINQFERLQDEYLERVERIYDLALKTALLEDFLWLHPCHLTVREQEELVYSCLDLWSFQTHPLVTRILIAESELEEIFSNYNATTTERKELVRRLAKGSITNTTVARAERQLADARSSKLQLQPKATASAPSVPQSHAAEPISPQTDPEMRLKLFVRGLANLSRAQQNRILHLGRLMNTECIRSLSNTVTCLENYSGADHLEYMERTYHQLHSIDAATQPTSVLRLTAKTTLPPTESATQLLERLSGATVIGWADMIKLKKLLAQGKIGDELMMTALKHIICYELSRGAHKAKHGSQYRIEYRSVVSKCLRSDYRPLGEEALQELVRTGAIVTRKAGMRPQRLDDAVKLSDETMYRYKNPAS